MAAEERGLGDLVHEIRVPVLAAMAWAGLGMATWSIIPGDPGLAYAWLAVRGALVGAAGYLATRRDRFGLLHAAFAGIIVMFCDHVLVNGLAFLATGQFKAAAGVVASFVIFFWVAAMVGSLGGLVGRIAARSRSRRCNAPLSD
jgi:hypothetical protein